LTSRVEALDLVSKVQTFAFALTLRV